MTDHFARLGEARRPWIDRDALKAKFLRLSAELHPDKAASDKRQAEEEFRALNESYNVLQNTRARLLHLLELESGSKPKHVDNVPAIAVELFSSIASMTRRADALLKEKEAAQSPMVKVQVLERALGCVDDIQELQKELQKRIASIEDRVQHLGSEWEKSNDSAPNLLAISEAAAGLGFLERWNAQLQERATSLTF